MKLIDDWRLIARKAWSMKWMYGATGLAGTQVILSLFESKLPKILFAVLTLLAIFAGIVARVIVQEQLHDDQ